MIKKIINPTGGRLLKNEDLRSFEDALQTIESYMNAHNIGDVTVHSELYTDLSGTRYKGIAKYQGVLCSFDMTLGQHIARYEAGEDTPRVFFDGISKDTQYLARLIEDPAGDIDLRDFDVLSNQVLKYEPLAGYFSGARINLTGGQILSYPYLEIAADVVKQKRMIVNVGAGSYYRLGYAKDPTTVKSNSYQFRLTGGMNGRDGYVVATAHTLNNAAAINSAVIEFTTISGTGVDNMPHLFISDNASNVAPYGDVYTVYVQTPIAFDIDHGAPQDVYIEMISENTQDRSSYAFIWDMSLVSTPTDISGAATNIMATLQDASVLADNAESNANNYTDSEITDLFDTADSVPIIALGANTALGSTTVRTTKKGIFRLTQGRFSLRATAATLNLVFSTSTMSDVFNNRAYGVAGLFPYCPGFEINNRGLPHMDMHVRALDESPTVSYSVSNADGSSFGAGEILDITFTGIVIDR